VRRTIGLWAVATGLAIAALAAVPAALQAPVFAWLVFLAGLTIAILGAVYALRGPTAEERRKDKHERDVKRHGLENERDELNARRQQIGSEVSTQEYWLGNASNYNDHLRTQAIASTIATLIAERDGIDRRLSQISTELSSA